MFKQILIDCAKQEWDASVNESGKGRFYRHIMPELKAAKYLYYNLPFKLKISLSRFRCSAHNLMVETGRHNNIPYEHRLCPICNTQIVEDEYHFVMICPLYSDLRKQYITQLNNSTPTYQLCYQLFNSDEATVLKLSKFIYFAIKIRSDNIKRLNEQV